MPHSAEDVDHPIGALGTLSGHLDGAAIMKQRVRTREEGPGLVFAAPDRLRHRQHASDAGIFIGHGVCLPSAIWPFGGTPAIAGCGPGQPPRAPGGSRRLIPAFQLRGFATLDGLGPTLRALPVEGPWMRLNFFLMRHAALGDRRPIDALAEGDTASVLEVAASFGEYGAP